MNEYHSEERTELGVRWWESGERRFSRVHKFDNLADAERWLDVIQQKEIEIQAFEDPEFSYRAQLVKRVIPDWTPFERMPF